MRSSISGSWAAGRMTVWPSARRRREHRVLGAHHGHLREACTSAAAQPAGRLGVVVAVAVLDVRPQRPHRVDVEVDRPPPDPVAARVADDHAPEPGQERAEQDERGAHLGRRLERDEQPVDVARGDLVHAVARVVDDHAEVPQDLGHDAHVLDLRDVLEPAALAREARGREQLEGGVLRAGDRARCRAAAGRRRSGTPRAAAPPGRTPSGTAWRQPCGDHPPRASGPPGGDARRRGCGSAPAGARRGRPTGPHPRRTRPRAPARPRPVPAWAFSRSISDARSAVSAMTTTLSGRTCRNPPAMAKHLLAAALADRQLPDARAG